MEENLLNGSQYSIRIIKDGSYLIASTEFRNFLRNGEPVTVVPCLGQDKLGNDLTSILASGKLSPVEVDTCAIQMAKIAGGSNDADFDPLAKIIGKREGILPKREILVDGSFANPITMVI